MTTQQFLNVGDVFAVMQGMKVRVTIPKMFIYTGMPKNTELGTKTISVCEILDNGVENGGKKKMKTDAFRGDYIVVETRFDGGGNAGNDTYPDGHRVIAQRLSKEGAYDPDGDIVDFYQSGYFDCLVPFEKTPVIRTLKKVVTFI